MNISKLEYREIMKIPHPLLRLVEGVKYQGIHLHRTAKYRDRWQYVWKKTKICGTTQCFKLALKGFRPNA